MKRREKKRRARRLRMLRWHLVHRAGCVVCIPDVEVNAEFIADAVPHGVRIPRSMRGAER